LKAIFLGIVASLFFASTFVLNRAMELSGGSWIWSSVLRYVFMLIPLLVIVLFRGNLKELIIDMKNKPKAWLLWSTIGFGIFYAPICFAAAYGPAWLVASTWQITIVAGSLLVPFFGGKVPIRGLIISSVIIIGVILIQFQQTGSVSMKEILLGVLPVIIAAFAYPLGNRKMMEICGDRLDTFQRVLGMTIASMPFWLILSIYGVSTVGLPGQNQVIQSILVGIFSGVIATLLFFKATDLTKGDVRKLAAVEATQAGEVIFALGGELIFLSAHIPSGLAFFGMTLVVVGMILHSLSSHTPKDELALTEKVAPSDY